MTLISYYKPATRIDHYELDGLLSVLASKINEYGDNGEYRTAYYVGAHTALHILRYHEFVETQHDFMLVFERLIDELEGIDNAEEL